MNRSPATLEALEQRQLLSASLNNGVLTVTGTNADDRIIVSRTFQWPAFFTQVEENGVVTFSSANAINRVVVHALGGSDEVRIDASVTAGATLLGGPGSD